MKIRRKWDEDEMKGTLKMRWKWDENEMNVLWKWDEMEMRWKMGRKCYESEMKMR